MKKNIFLIIITVITVMCIIIGTSHHLGLSRKGFSSVSQSIKRGLRSGRLPFDSDEEELEDFDFDNEDPKSFDAENIREFSELDVYIRVGSLTIERGNKWEIKSKYSYSFLKPVYTFKNGKLSITQPGYKKQHLNNKKCNIVITVPFGTKLDKLSIKLDVGAVELSGFDIIKGSIDTDVGAIAVNNVNFDELDLDSDVGAVSIELLEPAENYDVNINSDLGAIVVNGKNVRHRYVKKGSNNKRLRINTDVGGIEVK